MPRLSVWKTHIVGIVHLPIRRVLQKQSFETEYFGQQPPLARLKILKLELVDVVFGYDVLQNAVELVENFDPRVQV